MNRKGFAPIAIILIILGSLITGSAGFVTAKNVQRKHAEEKRALTQKTTSTSIPSDWKTYRNEKYGFAFEYPNSWTGADVYGSIYIELYSPDEKQSIVLTVGPEEGQIFLRQCPKSVSEVACLISTNKNGLKYVRVVRADQSGDKQLDAYFEGHDGRLQVQISIPFYTDEQGQLIVPEEKTEALFDRFVAGFDFIEAKDPWTYHNEEYGFELKVPKELDQSISDGYVHIDTSWTNKEVPEGFGFSIVLPPAEIDSLETFVSEHETDTAPASGGGEFSSKNDYLTIDGMKAVYRRQTLTRGGKESTTLCEYNIERNGQLYIIMLGQNCADKAVKKLQDQIVSTLKFFENVGYIEGDLSYSSSFIPGDIVVCAENVASHQKICTKEDDFISEPIDCSSSDWSERIGEAKAWESLCNAGGIMHVGYKLVLSPGDYEVYAERGPFNGSMMRGYYAKVVEAGMPRKPTTVTVQTGKTLSFINPDDWNIYQKTSNTAQTLSEWKTYHNDEFGIEFEYPGGWEIWESGEERSSLFEVGLVKELWNEGYPSFSTLTFTASSSNSTQAEKYVNIARPRSPNSFSVSGFTGISNLDQSEGNDFESVDAYRTNPNGGVILLNWTRFNPKESLNDYSYKKYLLPVLSSVRFIKQKRYGVLPIRDPEWIKNLVEAKKTSHDSSSAIEIWRCEIGYRKTGYYVTSPCCDNFNYLYDMNKVEICKDGGFGGLPSCRERLKCNSI